MHAQVCLHCSQCRAFSDRFEFVISSLTGDGFGWMMRIYRLLFIAKPIVISQTNDHEPDDFLNGSWCCGDTPTRLRSLCALALSFWPLYNDQTGNLGPCLIFSNFQISLTRETFPELPATLFEHVFSASGPILYVIISSFLYPIAHSDWREIWSIWSRPRQPMWEFMNWSYISTSASNEFFSVRCTAPIT